MKELLPTVVLTGCGLGILACIGALIRNEAVYRFRMSLLRSIRVASQVDIAAGRFDWQWRYAAFEDASYAAMMHQFWKPLRAEEWYADTSFLEAGAR